ncbi:coiled-coil domain-containing protein 93-like isoform X3 [Artemia franciscana]|uniref:coiled-coil domain-containing protein 93-like isoform X3 n=1 Tax=Artemia franciscana TaxID=6661 RepID=UPI0032DB76A5
MQPGLVKENQFRVKKHVLGINELILMAETKLEAVKYQADDLEAYERSMELLSSVGYTRAKSKTVQPFDKVAGGMVWCIERCSFDIDVDLYFKDNLNIGQKIALTEALVQAFRLMKCPHSLEPHQIQGLDYLSIYPVVKWLVELTLSLSKDGRSEGQRPKITMKMLFPEFIQSDDEDAESKTSENMDEQIGQLEDLLTVLMEEKKNLEDKQNSMAEEYSEIRSRRKKIAEEEETPDFQSPEEETKFLDLVNLVSEVSKAKENEKSFKEKCRKEKEEIEESIRSLLELDGNQIKQEEDQAKIVELQAEKESLQKEFGILTAKLAETNLRCSQIQRRLADIPSRAELSLYQKTFLQLNDQVAEKHRELTSLYTLLNSLTDENSFLEKELTVVDSVLDSVSRLYNQPSGWYEVSKNLKAVLDGLNNTKSQIYQKLRESKLQKKNLLDDLASLRDLERQYEKAIRELQDLLERNA